MSMPASIATALVKAQREARDVEKDAKNEYHRYAYSKADDIAAEGRRALNLSGLALCRVGWTLNPATETGPGSVSVCYVLVHESGDVWALPPAFCPVIPEKGRPEDKATAAALTYSAGYVALGLLMIERTDQHSPDARNDGASQRTRSKKPEEVAPGRAMLTPETRLSEVDSFGMLASWVGMQKPKVTKPRWESFRDAVRARAMELGCADKVEAMLGAAPV